MRQMLGDFINHILSTQADTIYGADYGTRTKDRTHSRNGYRHRPLDNRVGSIDIANPKLHQGSFFPADEVIDGNGVVWISCDLIHDVDNYQRKNHLLHS